MELELKYRLEDQAALDKLACAMVHMQLFEGFERRRSAQIHMESSYLDLEPKALIEEGYGLRLRRENDRLVFNLKHRGARTGALSERMEFECEISQEEGEALQAQGLTQAFLDRHELKDEAFAHLVGRGPLKICCQVIFMRKACLLVKEDLCVELALDQGDFVKGTLRKAFFEAELELKAGTKEALLALSAELEAFGAPCEQSKLQRALALS